MLEIHNLSFQHHGSREPAIRDLSLVIEPGTFIAIVGPSGSGKSTLLRSLNGLIPHFHGGRIGGSVRVGGVDTRLVSTAELSRTIGFVSQEPEAQSVFDAVIDEVAFGPENLGYSFEQIRENVHRAIDTVKIGHLRDRDISTLSGGERQRTVIAATLAMGSRVLVLDEPLSQLDPWAASELLTTLSELNKGYGVTVIIAEHRIDRLLRHCTHVLELSAGRAPQGLQSLPAAQSALMYRPALVELADVLGWPEYPSSIADAQALRVKYGPELEETAPPSQKQGKLRLRVEQVTFSFGDQKVLDALDLEITAGSVTAIMGPNGAGKTSLLRAIAGLLRPTSGDITLDGVPIESMPFHQRSRLIGFVPQFPSALFLGETVGEEIQIALGDNCSTSDIQAILEQFSLAHLSHHFPWDISGGERQRLALAIATAGGPDLLLLDEPTRGMDQEARIRLINLISALKRAGTTVLISTHDSTLVAECADHALLLQDGVIRTAGTPDDVLSVDPVLTPDVARVLGHGILIIGQVRAILARQRSVYPAYHDSGLLRQIDQHD